MGKYWNQSGQAVVEYVILLAIVVSVSGVIHFGVGRTRDKLWKRMICDISAPCPGCISPKSAKDTLPRGGNCEK